MSSLQLTGQDNAVMDVLMDGPETVAGVALELGIRAQAVRRSIQKLEGAGYVHGRQMERVGPFPAATVYELTRTRKAA